MKTTFYYFFPAMALIISSLSLNSCKQPTAEEPLHIAVSKLGKNYNRWLLDADSTLRITNMYDMSADSAVQVLESCHALLITGGEDVYPEWHNKLGDTSRCEDFDRRRDTLEIFLIRKALELKMPIVGICRGHQICNVVLGGSLVIDIPSELPSDIMHRCPASPLDCLHEVRIAEGSLLHQIVGILSGQVTSYHHQAVDALAPGLRMSAIASDGIVEAIEWVDPQNKSFLLCVQWHPERMQDYPELSIPLVKKFLEEAKTFQKKE